MRIASHNEGLLQRTDIKGKGIYQPGQRGFNNIKVRKRAKHSGAGICLWACITFSQCSAKKCSTFNLKIVSDTYSLSFITLFLTRSQHTHKLSRTHTHTHTLAQSLTYHPHTPTNTPTQLTDILSPRIHCREPRAAVVCDFHSFRDWHECRPQPDKEK